MMTYFEVFADSSANLPDKIRAERNIHIISYYFHVDGEEKLCYNGNGNFSADAKKFYAEMRGGLEAKTSLIVEQRFVEAIAPTLAAGKDAVLITIASGISGTYAQALLAKATLEKEYPGRKVYVADSANASLGEGLLVLKAADLRDMGESAESAAAWLKDNTYRLNSYLTVDDLRYLRRGGRISTVLAFAGTLLNIKPLITADGGTNAKLTVYGKAHGRKKALSALMEAFDAHVLHPEEQTVAVAHADCEEEANEMAALLKAHGARDVIVEYYDLCSGSHAGPGTLAIFFLGTDRRAAEKVKAPHAKTVPSRI